jgi:phage/plasmid-associated DNA primase
LGSVKELSKDETLDIGALKLFSGSDDVQARTLYDKGGNFVISLTMLIMLNSLPALASNDVPTWNRMRIIPFESQFDDDADSDPKIQWQQKHFKPDRDIKGKLFKLKDGFLWVFLQYFKMYQTEGLLPLPQKVKAATQNYRESNDIFEQFLSSTIVETLDPKDFVKINDDVFSQYLEWFALNSKGKRLVPPKFADFKTAIMTFFNNKKSKVGESAKGIKYFKYIINPSATTLAVHGVRLRGAEDNVNDDLIENNFDDIEEENFLKENVEIGDDQLDEADYEEYFVGPMFVGQDSEESTL